MLERREFVRVLAGGLGTAYAAPLVWFTAREAHAQQVIKVGVLYSLSGTTSVLEHSLNQASVLAIEEINAAGGVLGRQVQPVVEDYRSDPRVAVERAKKLTQSDQVVATFGMYTTASRQAVKPVFERNKGVLLYPTMYEGQECSPSIFYTGAVPNQQLTTFVPWCVKTLGPKFYLLGADYKFPKDSNRIIKALLNESNGKVVGEEYVPLGESEFSSVINRIIAAKPDVVFSDLVGDHIIAFRKQYRGFGLQGKIPVATHVDTEEEIRAGGAENFVGGYHTWNYFQSVETPENKRFVAAYKKRWGQDTVTHAIMEAAYFQVHVWAQAVKQIGDVKKVNYNTLRETIGGQVYQAPQGKIKIDPKSQHTWLFIRHGQASPDGQIKILFETPDWVAPEVYSRLISDKDCDWSRGGEVKRKG
jgi:urea transport system substrate-binding protein